MPNGSALHPEFLANGRFFQVRPRQYVAVHFLGHPGGYSAGYLRRLSRRSSGYFGFWHRHSLGDSASFNFCPFQQRTRGISFTGSMSTTRGMLCIRSILTFYHAGLWQRSLRGWRHGLAFGEGSELLGRRCGSFFCRCRAGFISLPRQVSRFPAQYTIGGQPSTTTKLHVQLGRDLHLQA
jgi:hypothetical protein